MNESQPVKPHDESSQPPVLFYGTKVPWAASSRHLGLILIIWAGIVLAIGFVTGAVLLGGIIIRLVAFIRHADNDWFSFLLGVGISALVWRTAIRPGFDLLRTGRKALAVQYVNLYALLREVRLCETASYGIAALFVLWAIAESSMFATLMGTGLCCVGIGLTYTRAIIKRVQRHREESSAAL